MTLLASERSILIRNKFRSVLQLRIQNRRQQNEINGDSGLKSSCPPKPGEKNTNKETRQTDDAATQKSPPGGLTAETAQDSGVGGAQRQKRARLADDLTEKIRLRPGPTPGLLELRNKNILPLENSSISFPAAPDGFEDDVSCSCSPSSSSPEQLGMHQSPAFSLSPGVTSDQSLSDLSPVRTPLSHSPNQCSLVLLPATESINQPMTMTVGETNSLTTPGRSKGIYMTSQTTPLLPKTAAQPLPPPHSMPGSSLASTRPPRPRKPRDAKPKMRELKYHQYIPPDQRGGTGGGASATSSAPKPQVPAQSADPAYSRLLQQQQVFVQLQILNQQQRITVAASGDSQLVRLSGAPQQTQASASPPANPAPVESSPAPKPELQLLPPNLDDLTVSELRQHLRKRGLPVSGTKPALLDRLRPFQMPRPCPLAPTAPQCQPIPNTPDSTSTSSSSSRSSSSSPSIHTPELANNPSHIYIQPQPELQPQVAVAGQADPGLASVGFLASGSTPSSGSSPVLQAASPLSTTAPWRSEQAAEELSVELKMRERMRNRPRERRQEIGTEACGVLLHPFLQQEPGFSQGRADQDGQPDALFSQVFCSQPCDVIGQDFELPSQITASPGQSSPSVRSLEEELQEAIQRVQMDPSQSIDDILGGTIGHSGDASAVTEMLSPVNVLTASSPSPLSSDQLQASQGPSKENFLSSPLCSSFLLELPPSPSSGLTLASAPAPPPMPPPTLCTTPPPGRSSRKRREASTFDPADWLESPLSPPLPPFRESDFGLDSDLNVNRVLDLMVEQW